MHIAVGISLIVVNIMCGRGREGCRNSRTYLLLHCATQTQSFNLRVVCVMCGDVVGGEGVGVVVCVWVSVGSDVCVVMLTIQGHRG